MRAIRFTLALVPFMTVAQPLVVHAQGVQPGDTVRVTTPALALDRQIGHVVLLDADSLVLEASPNRWTVPVDVITEFDVLRGYRRNGTKGALIGGAAVFGVTFLALTTTQTSSACESDSGGNLCLGVSALAGLGGALLGAVIGSAIRSERWVRVLRPR